MPNDFCIIRCEQYVLQTFGITVSKEELVSKASNPDWSRDGNKPIFSIGSLCADYGLCACRQFNASLEDVRTALVRGDSVIVTVDGGELTGNRIAEKVEDRYVGQIPDHAIVILSLEEDVVAFDPAQGDKPQHITRERFIDAWRDSSFYMVTVNTTEKVANNYHPVLLDLSDVNLPESLIELSEAIAENNHTVWARRQIETGWTYGPIRDDAAKKHPSLLPYSALPDSEKEFDRKTAADTIKLIAKLGFEITKQ